MAERTLSSGVQELIERLREEGVVEGKQEAERVVSEAHRRAKHILDEAHKEAEEVRGKALREAEHFRASARDALQLAARDTVLTLKGVLTSGFARRIRALVSHTLQDEAFLQQLILEVARRAVPEPGEGEKREIILPRDVVGLAELRRHPEKVREGSLGHFVLSISRELLAEGVSIREGKGRSVGIHVRMVEDEVVIDLTDEAVSEVLLEHLLPRFRALLEGSIG